METSLWPIQAFDPQADYLVIERRLPHWSQAGTVCFITFRTFDSMPAAILKRWHADRDRWLRQLGINPHEASWRKKLAELGPATQLEFTRTFSDRWHDQLDAGHGECLLARPELRAIIAESLRFYDGQHYQLSDFVIMPNHVHLLAAFRDEKGMLAQCRTWKHFTATRINRELGRNGRFWQQDGFDHLVRSDDDFRGFQRYIAANPVKARLSEGSYTTYSRG